MPPFRTTLRAGQSAATPTRLLGRFPLNRDGPVRRARRSRLKEWNSKAVCPDSGKACSAEPAAQFVKPWQMGRPTRFERVTFAFGGQTPTSAIREQCI